MTSDTSTPKRLDPQQGSSVHRLPQGSQRRLIILAVCSLFAAALLLKFGVLGGHVTTGTETAKSMLPSDLDHSSAEDRHAPTMTVKVVRPKKDENSEILLERIATVEPYYRADLRARASGLVKAVHFDIGETVKQGDVLIEIDVSEWEQDVAQKAALVAQRTFELKVSEAKRQDAEAARGVTAATIQQKEAEVESIRATRDFKQRKVDRFQKLAKKGNITGNVVEEEELDLLASQAALRSALANVERAKADHAESASKLDAAIADVDLKRAQIEVAQKDFERAKVVANYGKVIAPFDGVIIRRNVDLGSFVQNATTGSSECLISLARIDLLTVVAQFPDNVAPMIRPGTPAVINISDLAGIAVSTKVTRFSPSIQNSDRTMRVEVDVFNGNRDEFHSLERLFRESGSRQLLKGTDAALPEPAFQDDAEEGRRLLPGMNGSMKLSVGGGETYVVPSTAVYSRSGTKYLLLVEDGHAKQVPVQIHLNDGRKTQLSLVAKSTGKAGPEIEQLMELKGDELIVIANQLQVADGAEVRTAVAEW